MNKETIQKQVYQYTSVFEPAEEGGYVVSIPTLPGCHSQGDTFEEAFANIKEAAELYLEVKQEQGEPIPQDRSPVIVVPVPITL